MNETLILPDERIMKQIFILRNQKVMLDTHLAELFDVKPRRLREQVKRNIFKFPYHFMFQITEDEVELLKVSQIATPSKQKLGGSLPYVFTEHGILQLSNILRSDRATEMSIRIIEVFIKMREMLLNHNDILIELENLKKKIDGQDDRIDMIYDYLMQLVKQKNEIREQVGYKLSEK